MPRICHVHAHRNSPLPTAPFAAELMRAHPFASLISNDDASLPYISHLPLVLDDRGEAGLALWGHCAKPNPHWRYLQARPQAVVSFLGPHAYLSPSVYPDLARVPTWNYLAVHCTVQARLIDTPAEKDALLKRLIGEHEPGYAQQWRDLGEAFQHKMLNGIVGFELQVTALQCKLKLNQHRRESHAAMAALYAQGTSDERALVVWMRRLGMAADAAQPECPDMRIFGLLGLVLALVIVGLLVRKQLGGVAQPVVSPAPTTAGTVPPADVRGQSQQIQQQIKQSLDAAMQAPRKMPDDN